ncbi:type II CAAX endopeptidase family protein [Haloarculaceae archaeon H-GB11]|nr:type II CAAX endopeptidase family protein [Haloarculaceae archaeon H-GB11]
MAEQQHPTLNPWRTGLEVVGLTVLALVISIVGGVAFIVPVLVLGFDVAATAVLVGLTAAGQVGLLVVGYAFVRRRRMEVPFATPSRAQWRTIAVGVVVALLAAIGFSTLLTRLNLVPESVIGETAAVDPTFLLGLAVLSVLLVAPAEELLFRGAIQGRLRQSVGPVPAIAIASLLFGSIHVANYTGKVAPILATSLLLAVIGAIFGTLYERTGNLAVPIVVHAAYNVVLLVTAFVAS